jgi:hypothetical protein
MIEGLFGTLTIFRDGDCELVIQLVGAKSEAFEIAKQVQGFGIIPGAKKILVFYNSEQGRSSFAVYDIDDQFISEKVVCQKEFSYNHKISLSDRVMVSGDILSLRFKDGTTKQYDLKNSRWLQAPTQIKDHVVAPRSSYWFTWHKVGLIVAGGVAIATCVMLLKSKHPGAFAKLW